MAFSKTKIRESPMKRLKIIFNNYLSIKYSISLIWMSCILLSGCIPEKHWGKRYESDFEDVTTLQNICFSGVLFCLQGMQKIMMPEGKVIYERWPVGFDSLQLVQYQGDEYFYLNLKDTIASNRIYYEDYKADIYISKNWPYPGSKIYLDLLNLGGTGQYKLELDMQDTLSGGIWNFRLLMTGWGGQYTYRRGNKWEAHYEVTWNPGNRNNLEDDKICFTGLGKFLANNAAISREKGLSFLVTDTHCMYAAIPGISGKGLKMFPFNMPMASFDSEKINTRFPESHKSPYYLLILNGASQNHTWKFYENHFSVYSDLLMHFKII
jgi:hypothetical protein